MGARERAVLNFVIYIHINPLHLRFCSPKQILTKGFSANNLFVKLQETPLREQGAVQRIKGRQ